jgi:hypothetical protein
MSNDKKNEVYMCSKGGLFLEEIPIKLLKPNLQHLTSSYAYKDNMAEYANNMKYFHPI